MALLFINELINYLSYKTSSIMYVDVNRGQDKLKVNLDIDISHIPCDLLAILTADALGERSTDIKGENFIRSISSIDESNYRINFFCDIETSTPVSSEALYLDTEHT